MKSAVLRFLVEASRPATFTCASLPNRTPFGFRMMTLPLACRLPRICEPLAPITRFSATALLSGWTKRTVFCAPTSKLCHWVTSFCVCCWMVIWLPDVLMPPWPATIWPPTGRSGLASASPGSVTRVSAANSGRSDSTLAPPEPSREAERPVLFCLPAPVVSSLTATSWLRRRSNFNR